MTQLTLLDDRERRRFEQPPCFRKEERELYFHLTNESRQLLRYLKTPVNKVGFMLQLGYFKATARFYVSHQFKARDIKYVAKQLGITETVDLNTYQGASVSAHRDKIITALGWHAMNGEFRNELKAHALRHTQNQVKPNVIFKALIDFCWQHRYEVPSYYELVDIITDSYNFFEKESITILERNITPVHKHALDKLLDNSTLTSVSVTDLKRINQSLQPKDIQENVHNYRVYGNYYHQYNDLLNAMSLSDQATEYFATWVQKAQIYQLQRFDACKAYLYMLAFIKHQYYTRHDALVDALLRSVSTVVGASKRKETSVDRQKRAEHKKAIAMLSKSHKSHRDLVREIRIIVKDKAILPNERLRKIERLIDESDHVENQAELTLCEEILDRAVDSSAYYDALESKSLKLQTRVSEIVKHIEFNHTTSNQNIINAIDYFRSSGGRIGKRAPMAFLTNEERRYVSAQGEIRVSLYKALLFIHIAAAIKSGALTLLHSYRYKAIRDYLIDERTWQSNKDAILRSAGLTKFQDGAEYLDRLAQVLDSSYRDVNERYLSNENPHLGVKPDGSIRIRTPAIDKRESEFISVALLKNGLVPIQHLLSEVDRQCGFAKKFVHFSNKHHKMKPGSDMIIAGIISKGCNIGESKLANISIGLSENRLRNTTNWLFDLKNINAANQTIVSMINKLALANAYKNDTDTIHSSSDGKKMNVAVASLHATYSYKYFGKEKGVAAYSFIDERQSLFYATVISASDREAAYVIDGLLHNDVVESRIHSTDTHGYTEAIFAATHLIDIAFAPRIKKIGKQTIYGFSSKQTYKKKGYAIVPSRSINRKLILSQWDEILRFMATIRLKFTSASMLFKRLSSYAKDHPLYRALKEFGRIIKSQYILTYFNDVVLRQRVQKQLNRAEQSNRFSDAVFFDNEQAFQEGTKEEQEIANACKIMIQNAIVLWNYLYLSNMLLNIDNKEERNQAIELIKNGSVIAWRHVNMRGEYDFTRPAANDRAFDLGKILSLKIS